MKSKLLPLLTTLGAVCAALAIGALFILISGNNPLTAYGVLFKGAFFDYYGFGDTLVRFSPILLTGLAVVVPLRAGLFNIGAEGQIYMGGLFASLVALYLPPMPSVLHIFLCSLAAAIGGGLWALIPGLLRAVYNVNEVIVTLLLNYVAINLVSFAVSGPMMAPNAPYPYSAEIPESLWLPYILPRTDAHAGVIIGLVLAVICVVVLRYTTTGLKVGMVGANPVAAQYAGISVKTTLIASMTLGGALAGLAGAYEILGLKYRLFHLFSDGYGYDGIVVAFLASGQALFVPLAALFLSGLKSGASIMQRSVGTEASIVSAVQGLVVIFVAVDVMCRKRGIRLFRRDKRVTSPAKPPKPKTKGT
jgi:simple sugar transport system permease protein